MVGIPWRQEPSLNRDRVKHLLAILAGLVTFAVIFVYTGDADLLFSVGGGLFAGLAIYFAAYVHSNR